MAFDYIGADVARWHERLRPIIASSSPMQRRSPVAQLVKSIISGRTRDAVSAAAFDRLNAAFPAPDRLADADPADVERVIHDVTYPADKAVYAVGAMRALRTHRHGFDLDRLARLNVADALAFLETLPGVARKVSASTLNASTLAMPVMIVDTHVLRVLQRLGAVGGKADYRQASEVVTGAMPGWDGLAFLDLHVEMKRLGQLLCRPTEPLCPACPLAGECRHAHSAGR